MYRFTPIRHFFILWIGLFGSIPLACVAQNFRTIELPPQYSPTEHLVKRFSFKGKVTDSLMQERILWLDSEHLDSALYMPIHLVTNLDYRHNEIIIQGVAQNAGTDNLEFGRCAAKICDNVYLNIINVANGEVININLDYFKFPSKKVLEKCCIAFVPGQEAEVFSMNFIQLLHTLEMQRGKYIVYWCWTGQGASNLYFQRKSEAVEIEF
jgi:hypothetical protein